MSDFNIGRDQQKLFIEHFMKQVLDLSLQLVDDGKERESPGATIHAVGRAVLSQLYGLKTGDGTPDA